MIRQQLTKIALALAVLTVWGTVFYKVYQAIAPTEETVPFSDSFIPESQIESVQDTFKLLANYRDPFLGRDVNHSKKLVHQPIVVKRSNPVPVTPQIVKKKKSKKAKKTIQFPEILFKGYVENKGVKTLLIAIDGKNQFVHTGQKVDKLRVMRAYEDSVSLSLEGERRTFSRE